MSLRRVAAALLAALLWSATLAEAAVLVLRDGRALRIQGEPREQGLLVVFQLEDGTHVSLRAEAVDWPATERARELLGGAGGVVPGPRTGAPARRPARGPREFDSLGEERQLQALVHTGASRETRGPSEAGAAGSGRPARAGAGGVPPVGPPRPGAGQPLIDVGPSPYVGELELAVDPRALARVAALLPPRVEPGREGPEPTDPATPVAPAGTLGPPPVPLGAVPREPVGAGFVSPVDGDAVLGTLPLEARPRPGGAPLVRVEYFVDGSSVGGATGSPWQVSWRAPGDRARHQLEARFERADGSRETVRASVLDVLPDAEVDVELVPLSVTVTNHDYLFVRDLASEDFLVFEDGVRQEITHFSREVVPLRVLVAVDTSWSMNGRKFEMAAEALRRLVASLGPSDRVAVATFAEQFRLLVPFGADRARAAAALDELSADGSTAMLDAEQEALSLLEAEEGRRILLLVGDGEDYLSKTRLDDLIARAQRSEVAVYGVGVLTWRLKDGLPEHWADQLIGRGRPGYWTDNLRVRGLKILRRQSDSTGGVLYLPKFAGELPYVFEHLLAELKSSYQVGYYPSNRRKDGRFRSIQVEVSGRSMKVRTRKGYYAPGTTRAAR